MTQMSLPWGTTDRTELERRMADVERAREALRRALAALQRALNGVE